ncbi:hypothetical protein GL4_0627 [Methyloceanibacter caenitepidi]|uniref:Uncharacterized protein n=2 Tax=Methyloceanibacter caenitepidi TaxID=1384459 RepID=A0A0A8JZU0_9HYPH|nr:hypothetical protein GL4_0627 [Methyloceanibacter caenitepidi]
MGGFVPPRQAVSQDTADKDPEQMTDAELREACDVLEAELVGRAKDITPNNKTTDADLADLL